MIEYRYRLERCLPLELGVAERRMLFVMMNPSTADAVDDDPTIRKCWGFCHRWAYTEFRVVNLWAMRATDPADLRKALLRGDDVVGPMNDNVISAEAQQAHGICAAWGALWRPREMERVEKVLQLLTDSGQRELLCIDRTIDGAPRHPLMAKYTLSPVVWKTLRQVEGAPS